MAQHTLITENTIHQKSYLVIFSGVHFGYSKSKSEKTHLQKLHWLLSICQVQLYLNLYLFVVFGGVNFDQYASNFDDYSWKTVAIWQNILKK